jgi:hypothetical protein
MNWLEGCLFQRSGRKTIDFQPILCIHIRMCSIANKQSRRFRLCKLEYIQEFLCQLLYEDSKSLLRKESSGFLSKYPVLKIIMLIIFIPHVNRYLSAQKPTVFKLPLDERESLVRIASIIGFKFVFCFEQFL